MKPKALGRPLSIDSVHDGGVYTLPTIPFTQTNLFLKVGCLDELFMKIPSERGFEDYRRFVRLADPNPLDIRSLEAGEDFTSLDRTLEEFGWQHLAAIDTEIAHYLAVHKLQYERLRTTMKSVALPKAKFGLLLRERFCLFPRAMPALFQERVKGTTLWDMYDFAALRIASRWQPFVPVISAKLAELVNSCLLDHIDWNIKNFVFNEMSQQLLYVDLKPTLFVSKLSNEHNLRGIRDYFIQ